MENNNIKDNNTTEYITLKDIAKEVFIDKYGEEAVFETCSYELEKNKKKKSKSLIDFEYEMKEKARWFFQSCMFTQSDIEDFKNRGSIKGELEFPIADKDFIKNLWTVQRKVFDAYIPRKISNEYIQYILKGFYCVRKHMGYDDSFIDERLSGLNNTLYLLVIKNIAEEVTKRQDYANRIVKTKGLIEFIDYIILQNKKFMSDIEEEYKRLTGDELK